MQIVFNPFTGNFDFVNDEDKAFKPYTHFDCGPITELNTNWYNKIDAGALPSTGKQRKIDLGEAT